MLLILLCMAGEAFSQAPATQPAIQAEQAAARLGGLLDELAHNDPDVRERARVELMGMSRAELSIFRQVIERNLPLLPSQVAVLREVVSQAYLATEPYERLPDQGFLGVRLASVELGEFDAGPADAGGAVVIESRLLGFTGYRYLFDGDVIIGLGGPNPMIFQSDTQLARVVQSIPAGTVVPFQVLRQGRLMEVEIPLDARPTELEQAADLQATNLQRILAADEYWKREFAPLLQRGVM